MVKHSILNKTAQKLTPEALRNDPFLASLIRGRMREIALVKRRSEGQAPVGVEAKVEFAKIVSGDVVPVADNSE